MANVIQLTNEPDIEELLEQMLENIEKPLNNEEKQALINEIIKLRNLNAYLQLQIDNIKVFLELSVEDKSKKDDNNKQSNI